MSAPDIPLAEGWGKIEKWGIKPLINLVENLGVTENVGQKANDFVRNYDVIFKMCIQRDPYNFSAKLYEKYEATLNSYVLDVIKPKLTAIADSKDNSTYLREWNQQWKNYTLIVRGLQKLFMYLDRFYTKDPNNPSVLKLKEKGFSLYYIHIFEGSNLATRAAEAIQTAIEAERNSVQQDRKMLQTAVVSFTNMGFNYANKRLRVYSQHIEKLLVQNAGAYYKVASLAWLDQDSAPVYLHKAERMIAQEKGRVDSYLNRSSLAPLSRECYVQLLRIHQKQILEKKTGISNMLALDAQEDLSRVYNLYSKYPDDLAPIATLVHDHIDAEGGALVTAAQKSPQALNQLVPNLIKLHERYSAIVNKCFQGSYIFEKALRQAFETFNNKDSRVSDLLASYVNELLRKGSSLNITNIEKTLNHVVFLYGYIRDKDIFERRYQIFLGDRLIKGLCKSEHSEKMMISMLKKQSGYQWTNKLEGMFKDITNSRELMGKFQTGSTAVDKKANAALEVKVCTTSYWPAMAGARSEQARVPVELKDTCDRFKKFYIAQKNGTHKLDWRLEQGMAEIMVLFSPAVKRVLVCTTYQMMVMMLFNNSKAPVRFLTFQQILDATGVHTGEIAHQVLSLCHPKVGVLKKHPNTFAVEKDHKFMINPKFTSKLMKVTIPVLKTQKVNDKERKEEERLQATSRHLMLKAGIVRIMKSRKTLKHQNLVSEVMQHMQARFTPTPANIKKAVEGLIEEEYLERDENSRSTYHYLA